MAKDEAKPQAPKWQQYDPTFKQRVQLQLDPTPSEVQRQLAQIIWQFDQRPFQPKVNIKGKGRPPGTKMDKRERFNIRKKQKVKPKDTP